MSFWCEARDAIASAVPYYMTPCWFTLDPASLLVTSHHDHGYLEDFPAEWLAWEYYEDDFDLHSLADVARFKAGISTLHEVTGGDPSRSRAWRECAPYGAEQQLGLALRTPAREAWGCSPFTVSRDNQHSLVRRQQLLLAIAPHLAEGARRGLLVGEASEPERPDAPGLVVLGADWSVVVAHRASSIGSANCRASGRLAANCPPLCLRWQAARSGPPRARTILVRLRWHESSQMRDAGFCSTGRRWWLMERDAPQ